jgi:hypothetical protein
VPLPQALHSGQFQRHGIGAGRGREHGTAAGQDRLMRQPGAIS